MLAFWVPPLIVISVNGVAGTDFAHCVSTSDDNVHIASF